MSGSMTFTTKTTLTAMMCACAALPCGAAARFEISYPKEMQAGPLTGRVMLLISTHEQPEPRFGISFTASTVQAFGVDVEGLAPGAAAVVDSATLGYPRDSLRDI